MVGKRRRTPARVKPKDHSRGTTKARVAISCRAYSWSRPERTRRMPALAMRRRPRLERVIKGRMTTAKALRTMETVVKGYWEIMVGVK